MSKEIKFKAWHFKMKKMFSAEEMAKDQMALLPTGKIISVRSGSRSLSTIFDLDVMLPLQYTGLKDTDGKEIYQGDILALMSTKSMGYSEDGVIVKRIVSFGYFDVNEDSITEYIGFFCHPDQSQNCACSIKAFVRSGALVIGNIHQNPELLKGGAK